MNFLSYKIKKEHRWTLETSDGTHEIFLKLGATTRHPMELFLDNKLVKRITYSGMSLIPSMEYKFLCGEEPVMLVLHANQIDMVYQGNLLNRKTAYNPQKENIPFLLRLLMMALPLSAIAEVVFFITNVGQAAGNFSYVLAMLMVVACTVLSYSILSSPLTSKKKKLLLWFFMSVFAWVLALVVLLVFRNVPISFD